MKTRLIIFAAIMAAALLMASSATATHYGVFADGSYSPGSTRSRMDEVVTGRVNEAKRIFEQRNPPPGGQATSVNTENGLKQALQGIQAKCGDTITVVLMGHGTSSGFRFTKERKTVTHKELREWLGQAATECCAKINVVIFACHSGGFVEELFKDPHMQSVYTSSQPCKRTYSYQYWENGEMTDRGDWMKFFNEDWDAATGATIADQLEEASRTAREKMPTGSPADQVPTGWRRGKQQARAHVRTVRKSGGEITRMLVHFYDPEFLRCQERWVEPDAGVSVPNDLQKCNWINFEVDLDKPSDGRSETRNRVKISGDVSHTDPPGVSEGVDIVAHVEGVDRAAKKVRIHTVKPHWMYCTTRYLKVTGTGTIAPDIAFCKWIEQNVVITDPQGDIETPSDVGVTDQTFEIEAHVKGSFNHEKGTFDVHILKPRFMRCKTVTVQLPPGERHKMSGTNRIRQCDNIILNLCTGTTADGFYPGSNMHKVQNLAHQQYYHQFDAAVTAMAEPLTEMEVLAAVQPQSTVGNVGEYPLVDLNVVCTISSLQSGEVVYDDVQPFTFDAAEPFESGATLDVVFTEWTPPAVGSYQVDFEVLAEDMNPVNNRLSRTVEVTPPEVHPFPGDADLNGFIGLPDLIFVRNNLGGDVNTGDTWQADTNNDASVDLLDLVTVRNRQGTDARRTPPFTSQFIWNADGMLELPPDPDNPNPPEPIPLQMSGLVTLHFEQGPEPGSYTVSLEDISGTAEPIVLEIWEGENVVYIETGPIVFDIHDVYAYDAMLWGGPLGEFSSVMQIVPRAPELEASGIVLFPEPIDINEFGLMDPVLGHMNIQGSFMVNAGPLGGSTAFFFKGGRTAVTKTLSSRQYQVNTYAAFATLHLKNLTGVPDGKVKVKATVVLNGRETVVEGEVDVENGESTTDLKIAGLGQVVGKVKSVSITY